MKHRRKGQAISEYLILTALIAIASIAVIQIMGGNIQSRLAKIANAIGGKGAGRNIESKSAKKEHYQIRDLGDFDKEIITDADAAE